MNAVGLIHVFNRLCLRSRRAISTHAPLNFKFTPCLMAEPLKKKKRMDPAVLKAREDRKKKKIEKQIRRLEKNARQLKPIEECEVPLNMLDERKARTRSQSILSPELLEKFEVLEKQWASYKNNQYRSNVQVLNYVTLSQQKALDELRIESEDLYMKAVQGDFQLIPFKYEGPSDTPPKKSYDSPDGEYVDVSKKWG